MMTNLYDNKYFVNNSLRKELKGWSLFSLFFVVVYFFPLFPVFPWFNSKIAYLPLVFLPLLVAVVRKIPSKTYGFGPFFFCFGMFFLHVFAEIADARDGTYINSITTSASKLFNLLVYFSYFFYFTKYEKSWRLLRPSVIFFVLVTFLYVVVEVFFFDYFSFFIHFFYERDSVEILSEIGNSFFFTSYFAAHIYLLLFSLCLSFLVFIKQAKWLLFSLLSLALVFLSQSKTGLVSVAIIVLVICFFGLSFRHSLAILLVIFSLVFAVFLVIDFSDYYVYRSTNALLEGRSNSLAIRINQILFSFEQVKNNGYLFGVGSSRGLLLESWIASYLYQYGFLGLMVYMLFWLYLVWSSWSAYKLIHKSSPIFKSFAMASFSWFSIIPVISLSTSVWDVPKNGFFVFVCLAAVNALRYKYSAKAVQRCPEGSTPCI